MAIRRPSDGSSGPILEAVVFDLDGVLTDTASLHRAAWQRLFDEVFVRYPSAAAFTFLEAARRLGVPPAGAAVVEDAVAGVEAGKRGGFALVVGVDRRGQSVALSRAGARLVVADLAEVLLELAGPGRARLVLRTGSVAAVASAAQPTEEWTWSYDGDDPWHEGVHESLCALGNGYLAARGAAPEADRDEVHHPGTYVAGCYNRLVTEFADDQMANESLVNLPNWLGLRVHIGGGHWVDPDPTQVTTSWQELDLREGVLRRQTRVLDQAGRRTLVAERRIVNMAQLHLAAQQFEITATNWSGELRPGVGCPITRACSGMSTSRWLTTSGTTSKSPTTSSSSLTMVRNSWSRLPACSQVSPSSTRTVAATRSEA